MQNSPDLLRSALQNPTLLEAELGRRRARDGTDRDVLAWIEATFGVRIPAVACCEGHVAPAEAFLDALFARSSVALWIASRGFGGKTSLLALLAAANAILFETDVIILGGSGQQSLRVVEQLHRLWAAGQVPPAWLASAPTFNKTTLAWGNMIQALTASQTAVRGAHPTRLLLDEIDEMELRILEAAQGQPMDRDGVRAQTVRPMSVIAFSILHAKLPVGVDDSTLWGAEDGTARRRRPCGGHPPDGVDLEAVLPVQVDCRRLSSGTQFIGATA